MPVPVAGPWVVRFTPGWGAPPWAAFHELRMVIELDRCGADGEYEEMVVIYARDNRFVRWLLWRADEIVVQPLIGHRICCYSVAEAIRILSSQL